MNSQGPLVIDLLTPSEEEALRLLQELITAKTAETRKRVAQLLARHITVGYYLGAERAIDQLKLPIQPTSISVKGLDAVINELAPILEESFGFLAKDLTDVIEKGIRNNLSYWQIKEQLQEKLKTFGKRIPFQRAGKYREIVEVSPTGKMRLIRKKIKRNITISTEKYADMLARTATKKAYALGHIEGYKAGGIRKWRYTAVADERTRPHHLALHGKAFEVGSHEEQLALKVMGEPNCRCRPIPFFDNPKYDTPEEVYEQQKQEWARQTYEEWKINKNIAFIAKVNPQSREELLNLASNLESRFRNKNYRILGHILGMKAQQMAEDVVKTLDKNFFYSKKQGEFTFIHIYRDHILKDISKKTGKRPFTLNEVLRAKGEGKLFKYRGDIVTVWETPDNRILQVVLRKKDLRVITAYRISRRKLNKILREGEELAR